MEPNMVVMDIGSHCFKAGFAWNFPSDEEPRLMRAPCVEVLTDPSSSSAPQGGAVLRPVVERGEILDFDGLESIIHHSLYDALGWPLGGEGGNVVLSEAMLTSRAEREKLTQLMFEVRGYHDDQVGGLFTGRWSIIHVTGVVYDEDMRMGIQ
jgi:actin-related protein 7